MGSGGAEAPQDGAERTDELPSAWPRFAERLVEAGVIQAADVEPLRREAQLGHLSLPECLLRRGLCEAEWLRDELADFFGVEAVGPEDIPLDPALMTLFAGDLLLRIKAVPLSLIGTTLRIALVDPSDATALKALQTVMPVSIRAAVALERDVHEALARAGIHEAGRDTGDTAFRDPIKRAGEAIAAGRPEDALADLEAVAQSEPAGGTDGGRRLSFATVEEQQAYESEHPHDEVEWIDPAFGFGRYLRGVALGDLDRLEEAEAELERAVVWNPVSDRAHLELGWVTARRGRHREGANAFARAAELYRADNRRLAAQALRGRGYCLAALGLEEEARAAYHESLTLDPKSEIARDALAGLEGADNSAAAPADAEIGRLFAATTAGTLTWEPADDDLLGDEDRAFTCRDRGRQLVLSRRGKRYRLVARSEAGETKDEEQDGLLRRSRRLKPLFGAVARRTRVLER